jgi:hypothetical protein
MALFQLKTDPTTRELRQFAGLWLPAIGLVAAWLLWGATGNVPLASTIAAALIALGVVGLARPAVMRPLFVGWMAAAYPIGWVVGHLLLALLYFAVLTPIGLALRLAGRDPLQRRWDPSATTYWQPHQPPNENARYFRQY